MIIKYYKLNKKLSNSMRNTLSTVLIKNELKNDAELKISKTRFETLSKGIIFLVMTHDVLTNCSNSYCFLYI